MRTIRSLTGMQDRVAIGPPPYDVARPHWPTYGYDGSLVEWTENGSTGRSREEWHAIAIEMQERWMTWRYYLETLPDHFFDAGGSD